MSRSHLALGLLSILLCTFAPGTECSCASAAETKRNNLVTELLTASSIAEPRAEFTFRRTTEGWIAVSASFKGTGSATGTLDQESAHNAILAYEPRAGRRIETVRYVASGEHRLHVECTGSLRINQLVVTAIPELIHCGLGFDPAIRSYGHYDLAFLKNDILPNVTTLIVPHNIQLPESVLTSWHGQGKRLLGEVGINSQARTADEHCKYWSSFLKKAPFLDGVIVNEFIVNNPSTRPGAAIRPETRARMEREQERHRVFEEAIRKLRGDARYRDKSFYAYVGGSGKKLNQEMIGSTFVRTLMDSGSRIALERYLHEMSSEQGARQALDTFAEGIGDWEAKEPGVKRQMVVVLGLFSMPPGGLNKLPNVDYHVWMDQQMNVVANHPLLAGIGGLEWWTSLQADEETVRFVGKLYRHYALEGRTERLTRDPLFMSHLHNADFEKGLEGWTLQYAEPGSIRAQSFPRYGRIEGRYMGLGRPADPEHIGDTFLWMKRSAKGSNTFSQTIKDLQPGRLYSLKMFSSDYQDLVHPKAKTRDEATPFLGQVVLEGVEVDPKRSFREMYASNPEPRIPVWITYHWMVFRAKGTTAKLTVSDWPKDNDTSGAFGQEQTFNFLELQPYQE
jgi:hypothetical protein